MTREPGGKESTVAKWIFEPGHTAAEFCARHMMVTYVRGHFKNVRGMLLFDPANPRASSVEAIIDAAGIWTGEPDRDAHLRSADFLDVQNHPEITFKGDRVEVIGPNDVDLTGNLAIRGITRAVTLRVRYLGQWQTPWWESGVDKGPKTRAGFVASTTINRFDFGVNWNASLEDKGIVVGNLIEVTIDAEAILESP
jgi:polyisoprenoid-binding protein YceI